MLSRLFWASRPISWVNTAYPFAAVALLTGGLPIWLVVLGTVFFLIPYNLLMYGPVLSTNAAPEGVLGDHPLTSKVVATAVATAFAWLGNRYWTFRKTRRTNVTREAALFVLADGMGGHPQGEVAAQLALQTVSSQFQRQALPALQDVQQFLSSALLAAHQQILRHASAHGMQDSPRTTLVAAVLQGGCASWVHCGDSRLYWLRGGKLLARTRDHTYMEMDPLPASLQPPRPLRPQRRARAPLRPRPLPPRQHP